MWTKLKSVLDAGHVIAGLLGILFAAGLAWGRGTQQIEDHERRLAKVEVEQREDIKALRDEMREAFKDLKAEIRSKR